MNFREFLQQSILHSKWLVLNAPIVAGFKRPLTDVSTVDPASVKLIGVSPLRWSLEDICTPYLPLLGKETRLDCTEEGPDGCIDLTLKFDRQEVANAIGDVADGDELALSLTGNLSEEQGGVPIIGEDVVVILIKGK